MRSLLPIAALIGLLPLSVAHAADAVPDELRAQYSRLVPRAERALKNQGPEAAIEIYEDALVGFAAGYGRVHLRLAQLYQQLGRTTEVAAHFRECMGDDRVDELDRDIICKQGYESATVVFEFEGMPAGGRLLVIQPSLFAGPVHSGDRLPKGMINVTVEAPGRRARNAELVLPLRRPWQVMVGVTDKRLRIGDDFIAAPDEPEKPRFLVPPPVEPANNGPGWPVWVTGGTGLALVATGATLGFLSAVELDDVRENQRGGGCDTFCADELAGAQNLALTADVLWIGGAVVTAGAVVWWLLDD